jgi:pyridoxine kinase
MARVIALSSMVARGHVGLAAIVPALQRLGHDVVALPTVVLSNHLGHAQAAGMTVPVETLFKMLEALDANGWLGQADGVLSGYLPSAAHVDLAVSLVERVRRHRSDARFFCDPVLGDDPKGLYVDRQTAEAVRDELLALANTATPNRFELAWLSDAPVPDISSAIGAARALPVPATLATSIPAAANEALANVIVTQDSAMQCVVPRRSGVPHGTGDLIAALFAGYCLKGASEEESLARATAAVACVVEASLGHDELELVATQEAWSRVQPLPVQVA